MEVNALLFTEIMEDGYSHGRSAGAYRIATEIRDAGYTCQVIDFFTKFSWEELYKITDAFVGHDTLIIGFSSTFFMYIDSELLQYQLLQLDKESKKTYSQMRPTQSNTSFNTLNYPFHYRKMRDWFKYIRTKNVNIKIIFGGAKAQYLSAVCDAFAVGYCDEAIVQYMKYLEGKNPFFHFERMENTGQAVIYGDQYTNKFEFTECKVDWHKTDFLQQGEVLPIEISRGCIFKCKFCAYPLNGKKKLDYIKKPEVLREEFIRNYNEYGVTRYVYADDTHNDSIEKLRDMHKIAQSLPFELEYVTYLRHDLIHAHKETAALMRDSGLRAAIFGIESLNYESAKAIGKGLHPDKIKELLYWLKEDVWKDKVSMTTGFIIGLPFESPGTIEQWAPWVLDPACPLDSFAFQPLVISRTDKKSRIWKSEFEINAEKYGYTMGDLGFWTNQYMNRSDAFSIAEQLTNQTIKSKRKRVSGFGALMASNLGYIPSDIMCKPVHAVFKDYSIRRKEYIDRYRNNLLGYINNEKS